MTACGPSLGRVSSRGGDGHGRCDLPGDAKLSLFFMGSVDWIWLSFQGVHTYVSIVPARVDHHCVILSSLARNAHIHGWLASLSRRRFCSRYLHASPTGQQYQFGCHAFCSYLLRAQRTRCASASISMCYVQRQTSFLFLTGYNAKLVTRADFNVYIRKILHPT